MAAENYSNACSGRTFADPNSLTRDATNTGKLYIEDANEIMEQTRDGTRDVNCRQLYSEGNLIVDADQYATVDKMTSSGGVYGDTNSGVRMCARATVVYTDEDTPITVVTLAAGDVICNVNIYLTTNFNDGTAGVIDVGLSTDHDKFVPDEDVTVSPDGVFLNPAVDDVWHYCTGATTVDATYDGTDSDATQGSAIVYVEYYKWSDI